jgi:hypothetical protein
MVGLSEVLCPWAPRVKAEDRSLDYLQGEYHYYLFGRALGFIALVMTIVLAIKALP